MLKIGATIFLETKLHGGERERFKCRLVEKKQAYLFVDLPVNVKTNKTGIFYDGTQFRAWFLGNDRTLYSFQTKLRNRHKAEIPMLVLDAPDEQQLIRLQRRQYMRIDVSVDTAVHPVEKKFTPFTTVTIDLSGGGAAIVLPHRHPVKEHMNIECWFALPMNSGEIFYLTCKCKVVRIFREKKADCERASLEFESLNENKRQYLVRFCFEEEMKLRRKGIK